MRDGMLASTDGDLMYLQARVKRGGASVTLDEGTLTVKRQRPGTRFLFVEYPSLVADLKIARDARDGQSSKQSTSNHQNTNSPPRSPTISRFRFRNGCRGLRRLVLLVVVVIKKVFL